RSALEEVLAEADLDHVRAVVESLSDEHDLMEVALAAVTLAHRLRGAAAGDADEVEIPAVALRTERGRDGRPERGRGDRRPDRAGGKGGRAPGPNTRTGAAMTRLYVSAGRNSRV